ncbi:MAG: hypothetical protein AB9836_08850 [Aminipila sp.]
MNLLTTNVTKNMICASSYMKMSDVSMSVYKQAENKGDTETMKRSLGYTNASMKTAAKSSQEAQDALIEAQEEAKKQTKEQQQADAAKRIEKAKQDKPQASGQVTPTDTIEISNEGKATTKEIVHTANAESAAPNMDIPSQSSDTQESKIYTSTGTAIPEPVEATISVLA